MLFDTEPTSPRCLRWNKSQTMMDEVVEIPPPPAPAMKRARMNHLIDGATAQRKVPRVKRVMALVLAVLRPTMSQRRPYIGVKTMLASRKDVPSQEDSCEAWKEPAMGCTTVGGRGSMSANATLDRPGR